MIGGGHHLVILDHHFLLGPIPVLLIIIHHLLNEGIIRGPFLLEIGGTGKGLTQGLLMAQGAGVGVGAGAWILKVTRCNWVGELR